jgi:putative ATP-dependent endonuclease of OLD family
LGTDREDGDEGTPLTTILTTHSPHIASVTPIRSIVLLRHDPEEGKTIAVSTANAPLRRGTKMICSAILMSPAAKYSFHVV